MELRHFCPEGKAKVPNAEMHRWWHHDCMSKRDEMLVWLERIMREPGLGSANAIAAVANIQASTINRLLRAETPLMTTTTVDKIERATGIFMVRPLSDEETVLIAYFRAVHDDKRPDIVLQVRALTHPASPPDIEVIDLKRAEIAYRGPERRGGEQSASPHKERRNPDRYLISMLPF